MRICPECYSEKTVRNGRRGDVRLYKCNACGRRFSEFSGTILEGSRFSVEAWTELARCMLAGMSVEEAAERVARAQGRDSVEWRSVWAMELKLMGAVSSLPGPRLGGIVEFGVLYLKETQKGSRSLESALPLGMVAERRARPWRRGTELGECGPEYDRVAYAVDRSGRCACRVVTGGDELADELARFIIERTEEIEFACSNANGGYARALRRLGVAHYVAPRNMDANADAREWRGRRNLGVAGLAPFAYAECQQMGWADRIENAGEMSVDEFLRVKRRRELSLERAQDLERELRERLVGSRAGVSSRYLDAYVGWAEFSRNLAVELGREPVLREDATLVVERALGAPRLADGAGGARRELGLGYVVQLDDWTHAMRQFTGDPSFQFNEEYGVECAGVEELVEGAPAGVLERVAWDLGVEDLYDLTREEIEDAVGDAVAERPELLLGYLAYGAERDFGRRHDGGRRSRR